MQVKTYGRRLDTDAEPVLSGEHRELKLFGLDETAQLPHAREGSVVDRFLVRATLGA